MKPKVKGDKQYLLRPSYFLRSPVGPVESKPFRFFGRGSEGAHGNRIGEGKLRLSDKAGCHIGNSSNGRIFSHIAGTEYLYQLKISRIVGRFQSKLDGVVQYLEDKEISLFPLPCDTFAPAVIIRVNP